MKNLTNYNKRYCPVFPGWVGGGGGWVGGGWVGVGGVLNSVGNSGKFRHCISRTTMNDPDICVVLVVQVKKYFPINLFETVFQISNTL